LLWALGSRRLALTLSRTRKGRTLLGNLFHHLEIKALTEFLSDGGRTLPLALPGKLYKKVLNLLPRSNIAAKVKRELCAMLSTWRSPSLLLRQILVSELITWIVVNQRKMCNPMLCVSSSSIVNCSCQWRRKTVTYIIALSTGHREIYL